MRHQRAERVVDVLGEVGAGPGVQARVEGGGVVQRSAVVSAPDGGQDVGQQARVGVAAGQVDAVAADTDTLARELRYGRDDRPATTPRLRHPGLDQPPVREGDRVPVHPQLGREYTHRGRPACGANSPEATWSRTLPAISAAVVPLMLT